MLCNPRVFHLKQSKIHVTQWAEWFNSSYLWTQSNIPTHWSLRLAQPVSADVPDFSDFLPCPFPLNKALWGTSVSSVHGHEYSLFMGPGVCCFWSSEISFLPSSVLFHALVIDTIIKCPRNHTGNVSRVTVGQEGVWGSWRQAHMTGTPYGSHLRGSADTHWTCCFRPVCSIGGPGWWFNAVHTQEGSWPFSQLFLEGSPRWAQRCAGGFDNL